MPSDRFVVSLPGELGTEIDAVSERLSSALQEQTGIGFAPTRAQVIQMLVRQAMADAGKAGKPATATPVAVGGGKK